MKIEAGKYYKTRDGRKVGPMVYWGDYSHPFREGTGSRYFCKGGDLWRVNGTSYYCGGEGDLIAEWTDGPVRTVTRTVTEIVHGTYDKVVVEYAQNGSGLRVYTNLLERPTSAELKAAAAVLLELAGALPDGE